MTGVTDVVREESPSQFLTSPTTPTPLQIEYALRSFGYVLVVDGVLDSRAIRAIRHFQSVSGLVVDGIPGPVTWAAIQAAASATETAVRIEPPALPPVAGGLNGLPFAPLGLDNCAEMSYYRAQAGLPDRFDQIGYRESRCDDTVGNYCCHGYWANYLSSHLSRQSAYRDGIIFWCQVDSVDDIRGPTGLQKQRSACVTRVVFDISGYAPWSLG